jgi:hypothetical protein
VIATVGNTPQEIVTRLRGLPTAAISDALDQAGIEGALHGLAPLSNDFRAAGPAFPNPVAMWERIATFIQS